MELKEFFTEHPKVAIAFSGGCDSAFLSYAALKYGATVRAYYVKTCFQPEFEYRDALWFAKEYGLDLCVLNADVLASPEVASNPSNRCYHCKRKIFGLILETASADGFDTILDGSNASDDPGERPGMKALTEMQVLSLLRLCGLTKHDVRALSKEAGLFTWNKPAYACLATRVPTGTTITTGILSATERAEDFLFSLGFTDFRVRYKEGGALVQVVAGQRQLFEAHRSEIEKELLKYYGTVRLDEADRKATFDPNEY